MEAPDLAIIAKASEKPVVSLRTAFNAAAPANHLPAELVIKILTSGAWKDWWELVALTHICQHWRQVALGTPQLWADAAQSVLAEPRDRGFCYLCLPTFLARSGSCPLRLDLPGLGTLTDDIEDLDGDAVVKPHISHNRQLNIGKTYSPYFFDLQLVHFLILHCYYSLILWG